MPASDDNEQPSAPPTRGGRRLRKVIKVLAIAAGVVILVLIGLRLYLSDARIRDMLVEHIEETTQTPTQIGNLELSIFGGIEFRDVLIGPPPEFERDLLKAGRIAVHWSLWRLVLWEVRVNEVALEHVHASIEEKSPQGMNLTVFLEGLLGPSEPEEPKPEEPSEPLTQPDIPIRVVLERLFVEDVGVTVDQPGTFLELAGFGADAAITAHGQSIDIEMWAGVGPHQTSRETHRAQGTLVFAQDVSDTDGGTRIESQPVLGLDVTSTGFGSISAKLGLNLPIQASLPDPVPPVTLGATIEATTDLLQQTAEVTVLRITIGENSRLEAAASATSLFGDLGARVEKLSLHLGLTEITHVLAALLPGTTLRGDLDLNLEPTDLPSVSNLNLGQLEAALSLRSDKLDYVIEGFALQQLDTTLNLSTKDDVAILESRWLAGTMAVAGQSFRTIDLTLNAESAILGWIESPNSGDIRADLNLGVAEIVSPDYGAKKARLTIDAKSPIPLLILEPAEAPLDARASLRAAYFNTAGVGVQSLSLDLDAVLRDIVANQMSANLDLRTGTVTVSTDSGVVPLDTLTLDLDARRNFQRYDISKLALRAGELTGLDLKGGIELLSGNTYGFDELRASLTPTLVHRVLGALPPKLRPPAEIKGEVDLTLAIDGRLPVTEVTRLTTPPTFEGIPEEELWEASIDGYQEYLLRLGDRFARGLPLTMDLTASVKDMDFKDAANHVRGFTSTTQVIIRKEGPEFITSMDIDEILAPVAGKKLSTESTFSFVDRQIVLAFDSSIDRFEPPGQLPLEGVTSGTKLRYRVGGDLFLDSLSLGVANRGLRVDSSGLVAKPLQVLRQKSWEKPKLPGLDVALRSKTTIGLPELVTLSKGGPMMIGGVGWDSDITIHDGLATFNGRMSADSLALASGDFLVEGVTGALPVSFRVAFDPRQDAAILPYNVGLGSGVLAIVASDTDIRKRPARPVYYDRLRRYRKNAGMRIDTVISGPYEIHNVEFDGRLEDGILVNEHLAFQVLGGDVVGSAAVQLSRERHVRGDFKMKFSNLDASYFRELDLEPGKSSELSADMQLGFVFAPQERDLTMNMNVTKIGSKTFDRFLQLLDPQKKDPSIQDTRSNLKWIRINSLATWIRFENLNMDLDATAFLRIPGTKISFPNIPRELLRRYALGDTLDILVQPHIDTGLAPALGWETAKGSQ